MEPTTEEAALFNDITKHAWSLWKASNGSIGLSSDPRMFSVMLFQRLWSNHRGFTSLFVQGLTTECGIILRSGVETAICIAANRHLREEFITLMRMDAAHTLATRIKMDREDGRTDMISEYEDTLRTLQREIPSGQKGAKLDWDALADAGGVPQLYRFHRSLSAFSAHVTGASIFANVESSSGDGWTPREPLLPRRLLMSMAAGASLIGCRVHAEMIGAEDELLQSVTLCERLEALSESWL